MDINEAIQEFEDNLFHPSLKPNISDEAKIIALKAMIDLVKLDVGQRDNDYESR